MNSLKSISVVQAHLLANRNPPFKMKIMRTDVALTYQYHHEKTTQKLILCFCNDAEAIFILIYSKFWYFDKNKEKVFKLCEFLFHLIISKNMLTWFFQKLLRIVFAILKIWCFVQLEKQSTDNGGRGVERR